MASNPSTGFVEPNDPGYPGIGLTTLVSDSFASFFAPDPRTTTQDGVVDWGMTAGNSAFDNKTPLQNAINACGVGDEVYIPNGTYHFLTSGITLKTGVNIRGQSKAGVILRSKVSSTQSHLFHLPGGAGATARGDVRITDLTFDRDSAAVGVIDMPLRFGSGSSGAVGSPTYATTYNVYVARVAISGFRRFGVTFENVLHGFVWDCDIHTPTEVGGGGAGYGVNISGPFSRECWIVGNRLGLTGQVMRHGVLIQFSSHNNLVEENEAVGFTQDVYDCHGEDEYANEFRLNSADEAVRSHFTCGTNGVCFPSGIGIGEVGAGSGAPGDHDNSGPNNWAHHNTVTGGYRAGIRIAGGPLNPTPNTIVENNTFTGNDYGVQLADIGRATFTQVKFNTISGNGVGIHVVEADDSTITNNHAHDNTTNLLVTTAANRYSILNNCFRRGTVTRQGLDGTYSGNAEGNVADPVIAPGDPYFPGIRLAGGIQIID